MLKIIGGEYRSRQIAAPSSDEVTRPYTSRVREAVFNLLRGWFDETTVVDLFAGVGTMGLEAASRGAKQVMMIEQNREMADFARRNIEELGCGDRVEVVQADALSAAWVARSPRPIDVMFVDPPYAMMRDSVHLNRVLKQIVDCRELLAKPSFVVLRSPMKPDDRFQLTGFDGPEPHRYAKDMWVLLYAPVD